MKKNGFIALAITFSLWADVYAHPVSVHTDYHDAQTVGATISIRQALQQVGRQFGYEVFFSDADIDGFDVSQSRLAFKNINESLAFFRSNFPLQFLVKEKVITVRRVAASDKKAVQQRQVQGLVIDQAQKAVAGATVEFLNSGLRTLTDENGRFSLALPNSGEKVLQVSYIGFQSARLVVTNQDNVQLVLSSVASSLDEVVVIGYGQQLRAKVVGAVSSIGGKELQKVTGASFDQQLAGKISGVVVNQSNGQPGAGAQVVIRGRGTLTAGANPLIVVDGFPLTEGSSLNAINPTDIEDVNILKDAASAAIYGSRAANGVILVTTKQGKLNAGRTKVDLDSYYGFQQQSSGVKLVDAYDFAQFLSEARDWGYVSKDPANRDFADPNALRVTKRIRGQNIDGRELSLDQLNPYLDRQPGLLNTDWMDVAFRNAPISNHNLAFSGGGETSRFYTSLGYFNQKGVVIGSDMQRYSAAINLNTKLSDKIDFGIHVKPTYTYQNAQDQADRSNGALSLVPLSFPFYAPYRADGSLNISEQLIQEQRLVEGIAINGTPVENLLATSTLVKNLNRRFKSFGNVYLNYKVVKGLTYRFSMGGDYDAFVANHYYPRSVGAYRLPAPRSDANGNQVRVNMFNYLVENTLNYDLTKDKHTFNVLVGHTFQKERADYNRVVGTGYADDNIQNVAGASSFIAEPRVNVWALESYLARLQYDYDARYLLSVAIRRDGSSRFGANNRWGNFPSASLGWVLSREGFFPSDGFVSFAKLSASWGQTGNNQIGNYGSQALVTFSNYVNGTSLAPGFISTSPPNANLGWEVAVSRNLGLDLGFLKNKLNLALAYYKTNTRDLLLNVPVPEQTGYSTALSNIGEMENRGFEMQLAGQGFQLGSVRLGFQGNLTTYQNKVLALGPGQRRIATGTDQNFVTQVGGAIAEIYGYTTDGVYRTQEEINSSIHIAGTLPGDYRVVDVNGDGLINELDKTSKGTYAPRMTYGFGSMLGYRGFDFSFDFVGVAGRTLLDGDMSSLTEAGEGFAVPTQYYFDNRYHPQNNPDGFLGQPNFGNFTNARRMLRSSVVVQPNNGDYLRLRNVRLGYTFNPSWISQLRLTNLQVYVSADNVFTKTKFRGWNPDGTTFRGGNPDSTTYRGGNPDGTTDNILTSGFNNGSNYPIARTFLLGLKVTY